MSREITATELHSHIQAMIFGKVAKQNVARFDELQEKLHEIVDWYFSEHDDNDEDDDDTEAFPQ